MMAEALKKRFWGFFEASDEERTTMSECPRDAEHHPPARVWPVRISARAREHWACYDAGAVGQS
jgi:hypothetical protein